VGYTCLGDLGMVVLPFRSCICRLCSFFLLFCSFSCLCLACYRLFVFRFLGVSFERDETEVSANLLSELVTYSNEQNKADTSSHLLYVGQKMSSTGQVTLLSNDADGSCPALPNLLCTANSAADGQVGLPLPTMTPMLMFYVPTILKRSRRGLTLKVD